MAGSGFSRNNTPQYGGLYKSPAGKTTAAAGAGGAIPRVQAPAVSVPNDPPVDLAGLGGLLYFMGQGAPAYMSVSVPDPGARNCSPRIKAKLSSDLRRLTSA